MLNLDWRIIGHHFSPIMDIPLECWEICYYDIIDSLTRSPTKASMHNVKIITDDKYHFIELQEKYNVHMYRYS
jgi:hypothetical protein